MGARSPLFAAGWIAALACGEARQAGGVEELLAADRAAGAALAQSLADDALYLAPGRPLLSGAEARADLDADLPEGPVERLPLVAGLSADGRHGYTAGRVLEQGTVGSGDLHGKYLAYWRYEPSERTWRIAAYVMNPSPAAPDTVPPGVAEAHRTAPPGPSASAGTGELLQVDAEFSARSSAGGAGRAFREFAEPQALALLGAGQPMVWGDSAVGAWFGAAIPASDRLTWTPRFAQVASGGDLGFTAGDAEYRHRPAAGPEERSYTKYLTVWRRQPDGRWRYAADGGNAQPAPTGGSELLVKRDERGLRLVNRDTGDVFYTIFEQQMTALVTWRPCVDRPACRSVAAGEERLVPYDSIPGYAPTADSATLFWWRRSAPGSGRAFDSVRGLTVGMRRRP